MKRLPVFFFFILSFQSFCQAPAWTESSKRASLYPQDQYLQGYAWQSGVKKNVEEVYNRLTSQAKAELIEAIQVEVKSSSELQTKEFQDEFMQRFSSNTKTTAKANIVGMKIEKYFDKKEKSAYVFAYARKTEIADYYINEISDALQSLGAAVSESEDFMSQALPKEAISALMKESKQFSRINEARTYLKALGVRSSAGLKTEDVASAIKKRQNKINEILLDPKSNADALAYFLCYELTDRYGIDISNVTIGSFNYADSPMESEFSSSLKASFTKAIGEIKAAPRSDKLKDATLKGSFEEDANRLKVSVIVSNSDGSYSADGGYSKAAAGNWEPDGAKFLKEMDSFILIPSTTLIEAQCLERLKQDIKVEVLNNAKRVSGIPVAINNPAAKSSVSATSDASGFATFKSFQVKNCKPIQIMFTEPDLAAIMHIASDDPYIDRVRKEYRIPREKILLKVHPTLVYLESKELFDGSALSAKAIEPLIKEKLSTSGFELTQDLTKARYQITVNATARKGGNIQGLYFSYLDADLSVMDIESGNEVVNKAFTGQKQGGSNFEQAAQNAFKKTGNQIVDELSKALFND